MTAEFERSFKSLDLKSEPLTPVRNERNTEPHYCLVRPNGVIPRSCSIARGRSCWSSNIARPHLAGVTLEMPAGSVEKGETLEAAVI